MAGKEVRARKLWTKRLFWSMAGREDPTTSSLAGYAWKWILSALVSGFIVSPIGHAARRVEIVERDPLPVAVFNCKAIAGFISARNSFRGFRCYRDLLFALVSSIFRHRSNPKTDEVSARPSKIVTRRRCSFTCPNWPSHLPVGTRHKQVLHLPGFFFCKFTWKQSPFRNVNRRKCHSSFSFGSFSRVDLPLHFRISNKFAVTSFFHSSIIGVHKQIFSFLLRNKSP